MINRFASSVFCAGLFASAAAAQTASVSPRWAAYAGCWEPVIAEGQNVTATGPQVCVVPSNGTGAEVISLVNKKITERIHVEADGARHDVSRQGCAGWESAAWSSNERRLYFNSQQQCEGGVQRKASGIFAVGINGQWTNVVNVSAAGGQALRVSRYAPVLIDSTYPVELVDALGGRDMSMDAARIAARSRVTVEDVIEANKSVDPAVVQAWLVASEQKFDLDAKTLTRLADRGLTPATIDVMVAVSNPDVFAVTPAIGAASEMPSHATTTTRQDCYDRLMDPWGSYDYGFCNAYRRYGYYARYGLDPYRLGDGYGYDYGFDGYGYGYGYASNRNPVVIIVRGSSNDPEATHGRMTKNGYTHDGSTTSATPRQSTERSSTTSSGGSSRTTEPSGSGSSTSSSSSGRTAHPKPPATKAVPQLSTGKRLTTSRVEIYVSSC